MFSSPAAWSGPTFAAFVLLLGLQRLLEMKRSARHEMAILRTGGQEHSPGHFTWIRLMHAAWFVSMLLEVFVFGRPFVWPLALLALAVVLVGQSLRLLAIRTLGGRWTVRILTPNAGGRIDHGIYRFIRHPNYLGVVLEIAAVPMLHTAWITACVFSICNAILLMVRIKAEESALSGAGG